MTDRRVIVTGSRNWTDEEAIGVALSFYVAEHCTGRSILTVVHGGCPTGADHFAAEWCYRVGFDSVDLGDADDLDLTVREERHPADWKRYGRAAGPFRNREMVDAGADMVLAFPLPGPRSLSRGTWDCVDAARAHGIPVEIIAPKGAPNA